MKYNLRLYLCIVIPGWRDLATSHIVFVNLFVSFFISSHAQDTTYCFCCVFLYVDFVFADIFLRFYD